MKTYRIRKFLTPLVFSTLVGVTAQAQAAPASCATLNPAAIQSTIVQIDASLAEAHADFAANGVTGAYAAAARQNRDYIVQARTRIANQQTWLQTYNLHSPYVSVTSAAYNTYNAMREAIGHLHAARHWAAISAVYHSSKAARQSVELTTQAVDLLESLSAQATRCYVDQYGPFK